VADKIFITPNELVKRWAGAIHVQTLANWRNQGRGPAYVKVERKILYPIEAVEKYEKERMRYPL
jgi:hypothetical protein